VGKEKPIEVAILGGGCASISAAFELTRPEHNGKYHVTIYQVGWRLGGKGASGRGPADRIEEHGLHVWQGFYENAFRLLRECYAELNRDPKQCPLADWRDAFFPEPYVGVADPSKSGAWQDWIVCFPPTPGLPGDPFTEQNPFSLTNYIVRTLVLLRTMLLNVQNRHPSQSGAEQSADPFSDSGVFPADEVVMGINRLIRYGLLATAAGLLEAFRLLETIFRSVPLYPANLILTFLDSVAESARAQLENFVEQDDETRRLWEIIDLAFAFLRGTVRFGLLTDPRGFDAINDYDTREWLRLNGASETAVNSSFLRGLYDLALAYEDGDPQRPRFAAGQGLRGTLRMFFTYRGSLFWKMKAGMGDVVFAPFYEVLKKRGASFQFFHRLENVKLVDPSRLAPGERPYIEALAFDVQAEIRGGGEYQPLVDIRGLPCWPAAPDYGQLVDGNKFFQEVWQFESFWDRRKVATKTLRVAKDFDFVVLGIGVGAIPYVCRELVERDPRWRAMVTHVKTVATQAFQVWLHEDLAQLGWPHPQMCVAGYVKPFDTWADMRHLIPEETWPAQNRPYALLYFCNVLSGRNERLDQLDAAYPQQRRDEVRRGVIQFLNRDCGHFWPQSVREGEGFRWELLVDAKETVPPQTADAGEARIDSQFWTANVNPSDRYVLALPGSMQYRISPLDNTYDNLTIAGDWTDCGFTSGCVEAAVMSGRLAAHALSHWPPLEEIVGYDHP
jgi:uncharacterized protein with NAD-binding domain and iron-sulfur cluster